MSRKRRRKVQPGLFPRVEAPRTDYVYTPQERDEFYNLVFERGWSKAVLQEWALKRTGRSYKAAKRQLELIKFVNEKNSIVMTYKPVARQWRGGRRFGAVDIWILIKHLADGVPPERTAVILQRDLSELAELLEELGT